MRIQIKIGNGKLRRSLRLLTAHHARRTLQGLRDMLPRVSVSLSDVAEPTSGLTKRCVVEMKAGHLGTVGTSSVAKSWQLAIKAALRGASERLRALWQAASSQRGAQRLPLIRRALIR